MAAQRADKEEPTELRAPEIALCGNNCGNPATQNLCQSCFQSATPSSVPSLSPTVSSPATSQEQPRPAPPAAAAVDTSPSCVAAAAEAEAKPARASVNRCSSCRKRVGLTGFRCRCGELFCGQHRYSDRHGCSYDYKGTARDAIARDNPVVRAAKIVRI